MNTTTTTTINDRKSLRKLAYIWTLFLNQKNYIVPKSIDDLKKVDWLGPKVKINVAECFLNDRLKKELRMFANIIYDLPDYKNAVSYNTVYKSILAEIERELNLIFRTEQKRSFDEVLNTIMSKIADTQKNYDFFFALDGIELKGIRHIDFKSADIFRFTRGYAKKLIAKQRNNQKNKEFIEHMSSFIDNNLLNKLCIKCSCFGDYDKAHEIARIKSREILNFWRFIVCILIHDRIYENSVKINLSSETYARDDKFLAIDLSDSGAMISLNRGRRTVEPLPITKERLKELYENIFLDDIIAILNTIDRTEVEGIIVTAIYWAGEAQNDFDCDIAFLKYWTALECIFSSEEKDNKRITHSLAKGVAVLLAFSGFRFIDVKSITKVYSAISKLYDLRSSLVHRGLRESISKLDLVNICKYTVWTIMSLLYLRSIGYQTMEQINAQTTRIYTKIIEKP